MKTTVRKTGWRELLLDLVRLPKLLLRPSPAQGAQRASPSRGRRLTAGLLGAWLIILALSGSAVANSIELGLAGPSHWALLALGDGNVNINSSTVDGLVNDVGIVGPSSGTISFSTTSSSVPGTIYEGTGVTNHNSSSTRGPLVQPADTILDAAKADALYYAEVYKNTPVTDPFSDIDLTGFTSRTVTGAAGQNVYNLTNFRMQAFNTITITGPPGATFVFNISDALNLGAGTLNFGPTVSPQDVLFNVTGSTDVYIAIKAFQGLVLAPLANVTLNGTNWTGEIITGKQLTINLTDAYNPVPLPASALLLGSGLLGLGLLGWRRKRG